MALIAVPCLVAGIAFVMAADGLFPASRRLRLGKPTLETLGGSLTMIGIAAVGFGLPLFR